MEYIKGQSLKSLIDYLILITKRLEENCLIIYFFIKLKKNLNL